MKTQSCHQGHVQQMVQQYEQRTSQCAQQSTPKQSQQTSQCKQGQVGHKVDQFEQKTKQHRTEQQRQNQDVQHRQFLSLYSKIIAQLRQM